MQLVYAIKSTILADELTFDNVVKIYQRCNPTEWGPTATLGPVEEDALVRAPSAATVTAAKTEKAMENTLAQVVAEAVNRSIAAQEQIA
jgi:hypothetical protein